MLNIIPPQVMSARLKVFNNGHLHLRVLMQILHWMTFIDGHLHLHSLTQILHRIMMMTVRTGRYSIAYFKGCVIAYQDYCFFMYVLDPLTLEVEMRPLLTSRGRILQSCAVDRAPLWTKLRHWRLMCTHCKLSFL